MLKHIRVWKQLVNCAFSTYAYNRLNSFSYFIGKIIRMAAFAVMILSIFHFTNSIAGYTKYEVLLFFLTLHLVDELTQAFFRGIYLLKTDIIRGNWDYVLIKPIQPLFYALTRLSDILDFIFTVPLIGIIAYVMWQLPEFFSAAHVLLYVFFVLIGFAIAVSIHIISGSLVFWTMESANIIRLYRYSMQLGNMPPEIYSPAMQFIFTYIFPVIIMVAFPVKAFIGQMTAIMFIASIIVALILFFLSLWLWKISSRHYSSASS